MKGEFSDEDLARASRLGDMAAFRLLVERHRGRIYSLALRMVRDRAEAEDMAQEAFLRIFRGLPTFRGDSALSTWMVRVALNTFNRHLRRLPRLIPLPEVESEAGESGGRGASPRAARDPEEDAIASEEARRVRRLVAGLPANFRDAVTLFYLQDRSVEEAAAALGVSSGTLKSRLFRGREILLGRWRVEEGAAAEAAAPTGAEDGARASGGGRSSR